MEPASQAQIDAANAYEELFVAALFAPWAPRVAAAAGIGEGARVLDVACGTGVLAREAAARVGPAGSVAGLDPDPGMLAVAARLAPGVAWRLGRAEQLPYPEGSFDAVVSQFGLMFFADRAKALGEMFRVLAPGGRMAVAVWNSLEDTPAYADEVALLERVAGPAAANALRAPFVLGRRRELARVFREAGIEWDAIATRAETARFPSVRCMVEADLRGWLPVAGVALSEEDIERALDEAETAVGHFVREDGAIAFDSPAHIVTATKPRGA